MDVYDEELQDDYFDEYPFLVGRILEIQPEENDVRLALSTQFY